MLVVELAIVVLVEALCVFIAWRAAARASAGATGPMFVTAAFIFHGLIELVRLALPSPQDDSEFGGFAVLRRMVSEGAIDEWTLWAMWAIVVFTILYLSVILWRRAPTGFEARPPRLTFFPWYVTAPLSVLLWPALLRSGQSLAAANGAVVRTDYWAGGLANQFYLLLVALAIVDFSLRRGTRWGPSLAALAVGCISTLVIGQRLEVLAIAVMSLGALRWYGARPSPKMMATTGALILACTLTLTLARSQVGRSKFIAGDSGSRVQNLASATNGIADKDSALYAASNVTNRFDGNGFPAMVLEAQRYNDWRSGTAPLVIGANLALPSFLNPDKTNSSIVDRSEKEYVKAGYGMRFDFDYLPTQFGSALAMGGPAGLLGFAAIGGVIFALFDWFLSRRTETRLILGLAVAQTIIANYETDLSSWPVALRSTLVFLAVIAVGTIVRTLLRRPPAPRLEISTPNARHVAPVGRHKVGATLNDSRITPNPFACPDLYTDDYS